MRRSRWVSGSRWGRASLALALALALGGRGAAGPVIRLEVLRDTWVSSVDREVDGNNGKAPRLKLKSYQEMTLLDVDPQPLQGRLIRKAFLHVRLAGEERLHRVTVSGIGAAWFEGTGSGYAVQPGGATFRHRRHPDLAWSLTGGDLCHVVLGQGGTNWRMADASPPDPQGWQTIPVDPAVMAARVAGLSYGFLVFDDTGTEWTRSGDHFQKRLFPNRFLYSRDQNAASAPYFTVELGDRDPAPPGPVRELKREPETEDLPAGQAIVSFLAPPASGKTKILGFEGTLNGREIPRELIPLAGNGRERLRIHLRHLGLGPGAEATLKLRAVDLAGNRGPETALTLQLSDRIPLPVQPSHSPEVAPAGKSPFPPNGPIVGVIDELDKIDPRTGKVEPPQPADYLWNNHLYRSPNGVIELHAARGEAVAFQVVLRGEPGANPTVDFTEPAAQSIAISLARPALVPSPLGPFPDPLVPWHEPPGMLDATARFRSLHVELQIPHPLPAGRYHGRLILQRTPEASIPIELEVWDFDLPDELSFIPEMNCYGLPDPELEYYRLAHRHRTVINRVPYSQRGEVATGCAPSFNRRSHTLDWTNWDRRFGPLLDGSAFADLPRGKTPVEVFYLPLHENWPTPFDPNYQGGYWADQALPPAYFKAFATAARDLARHFQTRGWNRTLFECFLNNKNNFKENGWSRGASIWILDEPADWQDFWALRTFARAFHEGVHQARIGPGGPRMVFRADISRPQWRRDALDGLLDVLVVSSSMRQYPELVLDRKRRPGEIVLEYGTTAPVEGSAYQPVAWCLDVFSRDADGVIPWQTIGTPESWKQADQLALFYPPRGPADPHRAETLAPTPSIRLKAYRRGQQDVEYLNLWAQAHHFPRWMTRAIVVETLGAEGQPGPTGATGEDAGRINYNHIRPQKLQRLRSFLAQDILKHKPGLRPAPSRLSLPRPEPRHAHPALVGESWPLP